MSKRGLPKVLIYIRCPCCGLWRYLGKVETYSIWDILSDGFDIPFEVDYRAGGGRARGWHSRVRRNRLPNFMKNNYSNFMNGLKTSKTMLDSIFEKE
jgi:hypothetical protein